MAAHVSRLRHRAPIRLLWLIDSLTAGGAEALTVRFVRAVEEHNRSTDEPARRIEPVVAFLKRLGDNPHEEALCALGVEPVFLDARHLRDLAAFRRLLRLVRERKITVIHAHLAYASIWAVVAGRLTRRPVAASLHVAPSEAPPWSREGLRRTLRAWLLTRSWVQPVAVSQAVARGWERNTVIPRDRIRVIPNGVDVRDFHVGGDGHDGESETRDRVRRVRNETRSCLGLSDTATMVLTVAVLRRGKGLDLLIEAAPRVLAEQPGTRFVIVGDGPERAALARRIADRDLGGRVVLTGFRRDVPELLAAADVFALPSREDAYPTVLLEAAAAGVPVVAAETGGVAEIVTAGETGILVPPEDPEALASALVELVAAPGERRRLGEAACRRAQTELSAGRWLDRLTALYRELSPDPDPDRGAERGPLRLALVEPVGRGGLIHHAFQLGRALTGEGAEVILVTSRDHELDELRALGVDIPFRVEPLLRLWDAKPSSPNGTRGAWRRGLRGAIWYREQWRLVRYLTRFPTRGGPRPDAVLFGDLRFAGDLVPLKLLARRCRRQEGSRDQGQRRGTALVDLCHNVHPFSLGGRSAGRFERPGGLTGAAFRRIYRLFDRVIVHFESNRRRFLASYGLPPERVGAIPLGHGGLFRELARGASAPALRRRLGIAADAPVVSLLGSLAPYKGPDLAVEAFARIHRSRPDARLVLAGPVLPGLDLAGLRREVERRGLSAAVHLEAGYLPVSEMAAWMEMATVAIFPYRDVSQSAVVALALTLGVPPVVTRVGAMEDMVRDGETGRVVAPEDPTALAAATLGLLEDGGQRDRMAEAARLFAREELSWRRVARELLAEIRPLLGEVAASSLETVETPGKASEEASE